MFKNLEDGEKIQMSVTVLKRKIRSWNDTYDPSNTITSEEKNFVMRQVTTGVGGRHFPLS